MTGRRGSNLLPLKKRLTKAQQFTRRQRMKAKGSWRQQMEGGVAKGFGTLAQMHGQLAQANNANVRRMVIVQRYNLALHTVLIAAVLFLMGKIFGWW